MDYGDNCFLIKHEEYQIIGDKVIGYSYVDISRQVSRKLSKSKYKQDIDKVVPIIASAVKKFDELLQKEYVVAKERYLAQAAQAEIQFNIPNKIIYRFYQDGTMECRFDLENPLSNGEKEYFAIGWGVKSWPIVKEYLQIVRNKHNDTIEYAFIPHVHVQAYNVRVISSDVESQDLLFGKFKVGRRGYLDITTAKSEKFPFGTDTFDVSHVYPSEDGEKAIIFFSSDKYSTMTSTGRSHVPLYENFACFFKNGDIKMVAKFKKPGAPLYHKTSREMFFIERVGWGENDNFYFKKDKHYWEISFK